MTTTTAAIDALRAHVCWDTATYLRREARVCASARRAYRPRHLLMQALFFLAAASAGLALMWSAHGMHDQALPYVGMLVAGSGYFAYTLGFSNAPPEVSVRLWRDRAGAAPLEPDQACELDALTDADPALCGIVRRWQAYGCVLRRRDLEAVRASVRVMVACEVAMTGAMQPLSWTTECA